VQKETYNSKLLTIGVCVAAVAAVGFMLANLAARPPMNWLRLMPIYCLAGFATLHSFTFFGIRRALWFLALGLVLPYVAEYLGTNFGAVFGTHWFSRARDLGFQVSVMLPGRVPLAMVLTWFGMLYVTFVTAVFLVRSRPSDPSAFATAPLAAGFLMAVWQLTAGPVAVAQGLMGFVNKGFYHAVPLSSFVGWFVTTIFVLLFFQIVEPRAADADRFHEPEQRLAPLAFGMFGASLLYGALQCFRLSFSGAAWLGVIVFILFILAIAIRARSPVPVLRTAGTAA
jgi:uncharacterized membrane protein